MKKKLMVLIILILIVVLLVGCSGTVPAIPTTSTIDDFLGKWIVIDPCVCNISEVTIYLQGQSDEYICFDFVLGIGPCEGVGWAGEITYCFLIEDCYNCDQGEACYEEGTITAILDTTQDALVWNVYELDGENLKITIYFSSIIGGQIMTPTVDVDYYKKAD